MASAPPTAIQVTTSTDQDSPSMSRSRTSSDSTNNAAEEDPEILESPGAGIISAIFNLTNTIIGGGILALPFTFGVTGVVLGVALLVIGAALVSYSSSLLTSLSVPPVSGGKSYKALSRTAFGVAGPIIVDLTLVLFLFGTMIGYIGILGDLVTPLLAWPGLYLPKELVQAMVCIFVLFPLCNLKHIHSLRFTSIVAVGCIVFFLVGVVIRGSQKIASGLDTQDIILAKFDIQTFQTPPIIIFAFTFHPNIFPIWNEMRDSGTKTIQVAVFSAVGICFTTYFTVAIFGYLNFGSEITGNILNDFEGDLLFDIIKIGYSLIIMFSYPILCYPLRNALDRLIFWNYQPITHIRIFGFTALVISSSYILAILLPGIEIVFAYTGATGGALIVLIFPCCFYLLLTAKATDDFTEEDESTSLVNSKSTQKERLPLNRANLKYFLRPYGKKIPVLILLIFSIFLGILGVYSTTMDAIDND